MSVKTGNLQPQIDLSENDDIDGISAKKVLLYGYDTGDSTKRRVAVDADGKLTVTPTNVSALATHVKQDNIINELQTLNSLIPAVYDYIALSYTGENLTGVVFKTGGSGGTTISTLTLAYDGSNLLSVTKT